ncbi:hypothetical protein [Streptomyces sp. NPDC056549]|uniref:hypothetical protein n=1 Tax=Streptomyces sp. NPDC056549 TaxID=3345864 RepID=UPI00367B5D3F
MTTYTITSPDPEYSGESCGVAFINGTGSVSTHTKAGRQAVEYFRRRGYGLTLAPGADEAPEHSGLDEGNEAFDPATHDAAEVVDYLDQLDVNDPEDEAEFSRVIAAERAGKARKTVLALALDEKG